jgi:CBS domain-containing protein
VSKSKLDVKGVSYRAARLHIEPPCSEIFWQERKVAMSVRRIWQREVDVAELGEPVQALAERMRQRSVGCLVVVNGLREPIGIVTDRDLVIRVLADAKDPYSTAVDEVMTYNPDAISQDAPIEQALRLMRLGGFRRLPVVDENRKLVGIVTLDDILMQLAAEFTEAQYVLDRETPRAAAAAL